MGEGEGEGDPAILQRNRLGYECKIRVRKNATTTATTTKKSWAARVLQGYNNRRVFTYLRIFGIMNTVLSKVRVRVRVRS